MDKEGKDVTSFVNTIFGQGGTVTTKKETVELVHGIMPLAVEFLAPLVGIWSPPKKNAPFVCIEPWYGRCDSEIFEGELKDREWEQALQAGEEFYAEYKILV